jgi:hypothetical protein
MRSRVSVRAMYMQALNKLLSFNLVALRVNYPIRPSIFRTLPGHAYE